MSTSEILTSLQPESSSRRAMRMCPSCMSWKRSWTSMGGSHFKQMEGWRGNKQQLEEQHLNKYESTKNSVSGVKI